MEEKERLILDYLIKSNKISPDLIEEISEKMEIGLTMGEVLFGDNYLKEEELIEALAQFYRLRKITLDEIESTFSIKTKTFLEQFATFNRLRYIDLDDVNIDYRISEKCYTHLICYTLEKSKYILYIDQQKYHSIYTPL